MGSYAFSMGKVAKRGLRVLKHNFCVKIILKILKIIFYVFCFFVSWILDLQVIEHVLQLFP